MWYDKIQLKSLNQVFGLANVSMHIIDAPDLNSFSHQFKFIWLKFVDEFLQVCADL